MTKSTQNSLPNKGKGELRGGPFDIPIVHALYQTYTSFHGCVLKFPKSQRYSLGQTCQQRLLETMEAVISAAAASEPAIKAEYLRTASAQLDLLRLLFRLAKDCKCLDNKAYLELESQLHEVGRMLGGWMKSIQ